MKLNKNNYRIAIIGLGYVGLPLAIEFGKKFDTIGYDSNNKRINYLLKGIDQNNEIKNKIIKRSKKLLLTNDVEKINQCNYFIITVPTPIYNNKKPNLKFIINATKLVAKKIKKNDTVIYESTVFPGTTEEICVPILEKISKLKHNKDFFTGYSPERINPGDSKHTLTKIKKVISGSNPKIANKINLLYRSIIKAGTFKAPSIKVAESAKVIENTQRDINIAFINELSIIFNKLNIDTNEVLKAAKTKWNFMSFNPGLVGGHCIGVDPYYLSDKAKSVGYNPEIILAGRKINDNMGKYIANQIKKILKKNKIKLEYKTRILILGMAFKENCSDIRNTKVIDIYKNLNKLRVNVDITDPYVNKDEVRFEYGINLLSYKKIRYNNYKIIIHAVNHSKFKKINFTKLKKNGCLIYDVKSTLPINAINYRL
tara:strand:+ start:977 stop:2257 length:1281 start_codon:yes stop_codon:yes gene_type:complete